MNGSAKQVVRACLIGLLLALLLVGAVSGTLLRHVVQILPIVAALVVLQRRPAWGAYAAFPILVFWIFIVLLIWLFLLGLSRIANGHYTLIEIVSTFLMAGFCVIGVTRTIPLGRDLSMLGRAGMFVVIRSDAVCRRVGQLPEADREPMTVFSIAPRSFFPLGAWRRKSTAASEKAHFR